MTLKRSLEVYWRDPHGIRHRQQFDYPEYRTEAWDFYKELRTDKTRAVAGGITFLTEMVDEQEVFDDNAQA